MRRNVGISSLSQQSVTAASYSSLSSSISEQQLSTLQSQLSTFQAALRNFANKHRAKILSDPIFRTHFADMCNQLGVDPLGSGGRKGVWDFLGVGEWTYALAVQVVDVCLQNRERNGGLMEMDEVVRGVTRLRGGSAHNLPGKASNGIKSKVPAISTQGSPVTASDVTRAIHALEPLGCGYSIIEAGDKKLVRSVAAEFDTDSLSILQCASESSTGSLTLSSLRTWTAQSNSNGGGSWTFKRAENALEKALMGDGLLWIDDGADGELQYWVPALFDFQDEP